MSNRSVDYVYVNGIQYTCCCFGFDTFLGIMSRISIDFLHSPPPPSRHHFLLSLYRPISDTIIMAENNVLRLVISTKKRETFSYIRICDKQFLDEDLPITTVKRYMRMKSFTYTFILSFHRRPPASSFNLVGSV